jgi:hypothetical protein
MGPPNADIENLQTRSSPAAEMPPQRSRAWAVGASQVAPFRMRDAYAQLCQPLTGDIEAFSGAQSLEIGKIQNRCRAGSLAGRRQYLVRTRRCDLNPVKMINSRSKLFATFHRSGPMGRRDIRDAASHARATAPRRTDSRCRRPPLDGQKAYSRSRFASVGSLKPDPRLSRVRS